MTRDEAIEALAGVVAGLQVPVSICSSEAQRQMLFGQAFDPWLALHRLVGFGWHDQPVVAAKLREVLAEPTKATKEASDGPWEYQVIVRIPAYGEDEVFAYGPYTDENCAGLIESLRNDGSQDWDWKIQRRPTTEWADYKSGVN